MDLKDEVTESLEKVNFVLAVPSEFIRFEGSQKILKFMIDTCELIVASKSLACCLATVMRIVGSVTPFVIISFLASQ